MTAPHRRPSFVYFIRPIGMEGPIKIGLSNCPPSRMQGLDTMSPFPLEVVATVPGDMDLERRFHARFERLRSHGEWFRADPDLAQTIGALIAGTFDLDTLPPVVAIPQLRERDPEAIKASTYGRLLAQLEDGGVEIPERVRRASFTHHCEPGEKAKRRAIVREFVDAHLASRSQKRSAA